MKSNFRRALSVLLAVVMLSVLSSPFSLCTKAAVLGDLDGNGKIDLSDAVQLLYNVNFPERYPANQAADFNTDGSVDADDAIRLLFHILSPSAMNLLLRPLPFPQALPVTW